MLCWINRPLCRTVSDAVHVLDAIVGFDYYDAEATRVASKYIPIGGYTQFLNAYGLKGKRLGIVRNPFFQFTNNLVAQTFERHFETLRSISKHHSCIYDLSTLHNLIKVFEIQNLTNIISAKNSARKVRYWWII